MSKGFCSTRLGDQEYPIIPEQAVVMWVGWETPELHRLESWEMEKEIIDKETQVLGKYFCSDFDIAKMIKPFCSHCNLPLVRYSS